MRGRFGQPTGHDLACEMVDSMVSGNSTPAGLASAFPGAWVVRAHRTSAIRTLGGGGDSGAGTMYRIRPPEGSRGNFHRAKVIRWQQLLCCMQQHSIGTAARLRNPHYSD